MSQKRLMKNGGWELHRPVEMVKQGLKEISWETTSSKIKRVSR